MAIGPHRRSPSSACTHRARACPPTWRASAPRSLAANELEGDGGRHFHLLRLDADGTLLVAEVSQQLVVRPLRQTLLTWLLASGFAAVALALLLAALLARRTSAPLARLAQAVAGSRPEALPGSLAQGLAHDEVGELARHLDALHQRTRDFIAREQAFTADASHELRTPLAVLGMAIERLRQQAPLAQQTGLASMQAALWQLQQTVELLLALAREAPADVRDEAPSEEQPLLPVLEQTLLAHAPLLEQQGVQIELEVPPRTTRCWPPALTQLLVANLLANALAHARAPQIRIEADAHRLSLCNVSDAPPAALLEEGAAGRQPGVKGPASSGQGLGLSIVRRLAERHGLSLTLSHEHGHTCATLSDAGFTSASRPAA
jgi:signal transduction histidine kinase